MTSSSGMRKPSALPHRPRQRSVVIHALPPPSRRVGASRGFIGTPRCNIPPRWLVSRRQAGPRLCSARRSKPGCRSYWIRHNANLDRGARPGRRQRRRNTGPGRAGGKLVGPGGWGHAKVTRAGKGDTHNRRRVKGPEFRILGKSGDTVPILEKWVGFDISGRERGTGRY